MMKIIPNSLLYNIANDQTNIKIFTSYIFEAAEIFFNFSNFFYLSNNFIKFESSLAFCYKI
jgi:hypothetical protein